MLSERFAGPAGASGAGPSRITRTARLARRGAALAGGRRTASVSSSGAEMKMQAQVLRAPPRCVEPASRQDRDLVAQCCLREGGPVAVWQAYPERLPAAYRRHIPVGKMQGQLCAKAIVAGFALRCPLLRQPLQAGQQFGGGELGGDVSAEVMDGQQPREPGHRRPGRPYPPDAQSRPDGLLSEPTEITESPKAASGGGTRSPGKPRSASTSSSISGTPDAVQVSTSVRRVSGSITAPVGLWKVTIT